MGSPEKSPRILVIRRDNIGDLVCTTPLIRALREQLPCAYIAVLVTRYNQAVVVGNPDINALFSYTKAKHLEKGESRIGILWSRLKIIWTLRQQRFDWILLPGGPQRSSLRFAKWIGARKILVRDAEDEKGGPHHVQQCCHQLVRMGLRFEAPETRLTADKTRVAKLKASLPREWNRYAGPLIALHLSSRKPSQRWPAERFAEVARTLHDKIDAKFFLLWSPGPADNPLHPGDDEKARDVMTSTAGLPVHPLPTQRLEDLIEALSLCDSMICSDGGAMHLAAALRKPMVCLFGDSDPEHWGPWQVPSVVLHPASREVTDISEGEVVAAFLNLRQKA
jgi:ADP-heptose:LPS heptosyltransferase